MDTLDIMDTIEDNNCSGEYEGVLSPPEQLGYELNYQYIDMRFTFSDQDKDLQCLNDKQFMNKARTIYKRYIDYIVGNGYVYRNKYTSGFEVLNKLGENCKCHFHLRFTTKSVVQSIRRRTKEFLAKYEQNTNGNNAMMFKAIINPRNEEEYWRYPIKQILNKKFCGGFTDIELEHMHKVAKDSYEKIIQVNQKKMDKKDNLDTLFERLKNNLEKTMLVKKVPLLIAATKFYVDEQRPVNKQTIEGYVDNYMLLKEYITYEEFWL